MASVGEVHPSLMHYTTASGLEGILSSGSLRASHAGFVNDEHEIKHFFDERLPDLLLPEVQQHMQELAREAAFVAKADAEGGIANPCCRRDQRARIAFSPSNPSNEPSSYS